MNISATQDIQVNIQQMRDPNCSILYLELDGMQVAEANIANPNLHVPDEEVQVWFSLQEMDGLSANSTLFYAQTLQRFVLCAQKVFDDWRVFPQDEAPEAQMP